MKTQANLEKSKNVQFLIIFNFRKLFFWDALYPSIPQVPLNLVTATTLMLVKSGQLEDRGLVFGLLSVFLSIAVLVAATIQAKEEKRE